MLLTATITYVRITSVVLEADMAMNVKISDTGESYRVHVHSDVVGMNSVNAGRPNMAMAIEFIGVPSLQKMVITLEREDMEKLLFKGIHDPIEQRPLFVGKLKEKNEYILAFNGKGVNVRVHLHENDAVGFFAAVDRFYEETLKVPAS
jgi:hypothetical protein